ncbi:MAG: 3-phosphoshikimate 1-carboxyvinyltransferase [Vampirovibrionales bacterium]|nr:3-phosphoshikimate 1-carboxyvinyltransferase [Vampirovibrionales bacterium]
MMQFFGHSLKGQVLVPGDKSISHRALMFAALSPLSSQIQGLLPSADVKATAGMLRALGAKIDWPGDSAVNAADPYAPGQPVLATVKGGLPFNEPFGILNADNSGTTMRLMTGLLAGAMATREDGGYAVITGDNSLLKRPMGRVLLPLAHMGANVHGRASNTLAPVSILPTGGLLRGLTYSFPVASAQVKSALLLAGLFADGPMRLMEPVFTRDHTERMMQYCGVPLTIEAEWPTREDGDYDDFDDEHGEASQLPIGQTLMLEGFDWEQFYEPEKCHWPTQWQVPGDISSAAFWMIAASLVPGASVKLLNVGLNPSRTGLLDVLLEAGANISVENQREFCGEPVADLIVESAELSGDITLDADVLPRLIDEIPVLAVGAVWLNGVLKVTGAEELRKKESDRIGLMAALLNSVGVTLDVQEDGFTLQGSPERALLATVLLNQAGQLSVTTHGDHRIAMAASILQCVAQARGQWPESLSLAIDSPECVAVSYPDFFADLQRLRQAT